MRDGEGGALQRLIAVGDRSYRAGAVAGGYRGRRPLLRGGCGFYTWGRGFARGLVVFVGALAERDSGLTPHLCHL